MKSDIKEKLKQLKDLDSHLDVIGMGKAKAIAQVLTPEIKAQLNDIDLEYDDLSEAIRTTAATLEAEIKSWINSEWLASHQFESIKKLLKKENE